MKIQIVSIFPDIFKEVLNTSMLLKAQNNGAVKFEYINLRDFGVGARKQVDDTPFGGGDGMLLMIEPLTNAIKYAKSQDKTASVILMTPRGKTWQQTEAQKYANLDIGLIIICARYEGYDERVVELVNEQFSIGDYVLTGGEIPAMVLVDSITRLLPGVLGGETSAEIESFSDGKTLEHPQYTRPEVFNGLKVPPVLLSGHHADIAKWRKANSKIKK
jgi:tRNA (guanine37-N1)-methyltransferase